MKPIYGVLDDDYTHTDVSNTERGAKNYATRHGYDKVSVRHDYHVNILSRKTGGGKWFQETN